MIRTRRRAAPVTALAVAAMAGLVTVATGSPAVAATDCDVSKTSYVTDPKGLQNLNLLGVRQSWRLATGKNVTVAVVDSGVSRGNAHLEQAVVKGRSFVGGSEFDDKQGHGTVVAGIIAARKIKQSVLIGAAPSVTILPVRVFGELRDQGNSGEVADGIRWAAEQGASVINISLSTGPNDPNLKQLKSAIEYAVDQDAVLVASAGNRPEDSALTRVQYPAGFPGVIGVAATDASGDVDNWSIHGDHVDVAAPGGNVLTTFYDKGDCLVGTNRPYTSYATAYVSALAAQLRQKFPDDSAADITNRILTTADRPQSAARDDQQGWGLIQPLAALRSASAVAPGRGADQPRSTTIAGPPTESLTAVTDPAAVNRNRLLWWAITAVAVLAVALITRPLATARARSAAATIDSPPT